MTGNNTVISNLAHPRAGTRLRAVRTLIREPDPAALIPLLEVLEDEDERVRNAAVRALGKLGPLAVKPIWELMQVAENRLYRRALEALAAIDDVSAVVALLEAVGQLDPHYAPIDRLESAVIRAGDLVSEPICALLRHREYQFRELAAELLIKLAVDNPGPGLRIALPILRRHLLNLMELPQIREKMRNAIVAIEAATTDMRTLPLTAGSPDDAPGVLPIPSKLPEW